MGKRSRGRREEAPVVWSEREVANRGTDCVGLSDGDGGFGGFTLGQVGFILDLPFEGRWSFRGDTKEMA